MANPTTGRLPLWTIFVPVIACTILALSWGRASGALALSIVGLALVASVLVSVYHAEVVAHRVGEPFGTLILALAVTTIEAGLVLSIMLSVGESAHTVARDTLFAAVMIACNGIVGLCLLVGTLRHHVVEFRIEGTSPPLSALVVLATLTLVLPMYTQTTPGPTYSPSQLVFVGITSLLLYGVFVFVQTVRHRDYFLPLDKGNEQDHAKPPSNQVALASLGVLLVSLVAVIGLAKTLTPAIEAAVSAVSAPPAVVGIAIALLVLLPEMLAAMRAAAANRMQTSMNLALGSGLASIGLTIPVVVVAAMLLHKPLLLGLPPKETILLALTFFVSGITFAGGRATILQASVHLLLFAAYLFLAIVP
jgi:Ca2+:H+ antiporter